MAGRWDAADTTLAEYFTKLVQNDYLKAGDLQKIVNAPARVHRQNNRAQAATATVTLSGTSALKVYLVQDVNASNTIFAATTNFVYNKALDRHGRAVRRQRLRRHAERW